eukprot:TRINITY_DN28533_c1_g1_i1.p1 TRINITY_DN28533_c1_g1~~TRINITY_DN28533_c1_g1_i1.p1  ORF type:complete len:578 (-),score=67.64 TRINITY_DN28533_c1_g1_i1:433-2136(-)
MQFNPSWQKGQRPESKGPRTGQGRGYVQVKKIGSGGFGTTYLVNNHDGEVCVMKTIDISSISREQQTDAVNEAKLLASLKHPYIVRFRETFLESMKDGSVVTLAIVMDYAEGGDLQDRISKTRFASKTFPEAQILSWVTQTTLALKYMHGCSVLHRDMKSQNLFLTKNDQLLVGDFGISKVVESSSEVDKSTLGSPYYLAPEICKKSLFGGASDMWALGIVLFELAALRVPFQAQNLQMLMHKICHMDAVPLPEPYSRELRTLCRGLLNREHTERPTAAEVLQLPIIKSEIARLYHASKSKSATAQLPFSSPESVPMPPGDPMNLSDSDAFPRGRERETPGSGRPAPKPGRDRETPGSGRPAPKLESPMQRPAPKLESPMHDESARYKPPRPGRPAPKLESPIYDESEPYKPSRLIAGDHDAAPQPGLPPRAPLAEVAGGTPLPPRPPSRADPGQPPGTPSGLLGRVGSAALVNKQSRPPGFPGLPPRPDEGRLLRASSFSSFSRGNSQSRGSSSNSRQSAIGSAGSRGSSPGIPVFPGPMRCREQGFAGLASRPNSAMRSVLQSLY